MKLSDILFDDSSTLRSGWRLAFFLFAAVFISIGLATAVQGITAASGLRSSGPTAVALILNSAVLLAGALGGGWIAGKLTEGLPFRALGAWFTKGWLRHFLGGILIGTAAVSFAILFAIVFGGLRFQFNPTDTSAILSSLGISFAIFAVAAAFEEAFVRGYFLQTFLRSGLVWFGVILTSSLFGLLHLTNPNPGFISTANTMLAGFWFCVAYLKTRDLWLAWGAHLAWNWAQGAVFGVEVSGLTEIVTAPLLKEIDHGPDWLTGGTYGIEGGIACTIALIAVIAVTYKLPFFEPAEELLAFSSPDARPSVS